MSAGPSKQLRLTTKKLLKRYKGGERLTMLTAYDYSTARLIDEAGIEMILVGDSLGNVILGYETTLPVTLSDMIHHAKSVVRGTKNAFVICDLPFGETRSIEHALNASIEVMQKTGCQAIKLEGEASIAPLVKRIVEQGIPVVGHIGLTPQSVHQMGGYYKHGKSEARADELVEGALALEKAGAFCIVLECIVDEIAEKITKSLSIPTIGIGSGQSCSGEVLVFHDLMGLSDSPPSFARPKANLGELIRNTTRQYIDEVKGTEACQKNSSSWTSETLTQ